MRMLQSKKIHFLFSIGISGALIGENAILGRLVQVFFDFSLTVKAAPHECVNRTGQP